MNYVFAGASSPDPFVVNDTIPNAFPPGIWRDTSGLTERTLTIDPSKKTLVLICAGQSQMENISPTTYLPANGAVIDQFNIYDGKAYNVGGPLLGAAYPSIAQYPYLGYGNACGRIADRLIEASFLDRVIIVPIAVGGTDIGLWSEGPLSDRLPLAMRRLASVGITPQTPGIGFSLLLGIGEGDVGAGTTKAQFEARTRKFLQNGKDAGFVGKMHVALETWPGDTTSPVYQGQLGVVDNVDIFQGANLNTLGAAYRTQDGTHTNDAGADQFGARWASAIIAHGVDFS